MKSWLLFAKCIVLFLLGQYQLLGQNSKWSAQVSVGAAWTEFNGRFSYYNKYERYGKVPYDLKGYEQYFSQYTNYVFPGSGFGLQYSARIDYRISDIIKLGVSILAQPTAIGISQINDINWDGKLISYGMENSFSRITLLVNGAYIFKQGQKSHWEVSAALGSSKMVLREMVFLESALTAQDAFNGTAYDYVEREDWAFTWGFGLAYHYAIAKNWALVVGFDFTTFNLKPESATRYSYKINGEELVETLPYREQKIFFSNELTDQPGNPDAAQVLPAENYRYIVPQITLGVVYAL